MTAGRDMQTRANADVLPDHIEQIVEVGDDTEDEA
jgi:hypothetical protein